ncbi:hypothetical protein [Pedobacter frigoris]|uniref:hypothetical protein n=1 Tax=Pedobacter frigoris TaxID=2571272 RepID=UPI00292FACFC|nr:hypothetical protein [Pedobacter frigoris]
MRLFKYLFLILLYFSCKQHAQKTVVPAGNKTPAPVRDNILKTAEASINGDHYLIQYTSTYNMYILKNNRDTIFKETDAAADFEFKDFDMDGYKDIRLYYMTNVPGIEGFLLYEPKSKTFKNVLNFQDFPSPVKIGGTQYYYSYHRSGCADMNWTSDLFYIENYQCKKIGTINGYECENSGIKDGIYIAKASGTKQTVIRELPISTIKRYKEYKWGFIADYWQNNYKLFVTAF